MAKQDDRYYLPVEPEDPVLTAPQLPPVVVIAPDTSGGGNSRTSRKTLEKTEPRVQKITVATGKVLPLVYGRVMLAPQVGYPWVDGTTLWFPAYWCEGEIESITLKYDGAVTTTRHGTHYYGTATQTVDSWLASEIGYTDAHENVAYSTIKLNGSSDPSKLMAEIEGRKVYDPRDDSTSSANDPTLPGYLGTQRENDSTTWRFSTNPALCTADFHQKYRGGFEFISWDDVAVCADYDDEILVGIIKRAEIGIIIDRRLNFKEHFKVLKEYAQVYTYFDGDTLRMKPDRASAVVAQLTESDVIRGTESFEIQDSLDTPDQTWVKFTNTSVWPWTDEVAKTPPPAGGAKNVQIIPMHGWQSYESAYRYAVLRQNKFNLINFGGSFRTFDEGLKYVPGDVIELTHSRGLTNKKFTVKDVVAIDLARYEVIVDEYQPVWSDEVQTEPTYDDVDLPSPNEFPVVTGLTAVEKLWQDNTLTWHTVFEASFDGGTWPHTASFRYRVERASDGLILDEGTINYQGDVTHTFTTPPSSQGEEWDIYVWAVNRYGSHDPATFATTNVTGNGNAVPPTNIPLGTLKSIEYGQFVRLNWGAAGDTNLAGYEVVRLDEASYDADILAENDPFDNANAVVLISRIDSLVALLDSQPVGTYAYGVRPWDTADNKALGRWIKQNVTAENAGAIGTSELDAGTLSNVRLSEVYGVGVLAVTDVGDTWEDRFGVVTNVWPADTTEYWVHGLSSLAEQSVESEIWDTVSDRTGNWAFSYPLVKLFGGAAPSYTIELATAAAYPTFTTFASQNVQAEARYFKGKIALTPGDADQGFAVLFPMDSSYQGQILQDSVNVSILNQPGATGFSWNQSFTDTPNFWYVLKGTLPRIVALDSVDNQGGDAKAWDTNGNDASAEITIYAEGP